MSSMCSGQRSPRWSLSTLSIPAFDLFLKINFKVGIAYIHETHKPQVCKLTDTNMCVMHPPSGSTCRMSPVSPGKSCTSPHSQCSSTPPGITPSNSFSHQLVLPVFDLPINGITQDVDTKACTSRDSIYRVYLGHYHVCEIHPCISNLFFYVTMQHLTARICRDLCMRSLLGGHLNCIQWGTIMNAAPTNILEHVSWVLTHSCLLGTHPRMGLSKGSACV